MAVVLSKERFELLMEAVEDAYWAARAREAEKEGYCGPEEGERLLSRLLNAEA